MNDKSPIGPQFGASAFERFGLNSEAARALADELEVVVERYLRKALEPAMREVVAQLNLHGHHLDQEPPEESCIAYYDWDGRDYHSIRLRLAVDWVVSAGYRHMDLSTTDES